MKKLTACLIVFLCAAGSWAQDPGINGADILQVPIGVRAAALGGAYSALGDDVYVIGYNPAGLARVSKYSLGVDHIEGFADVEVESLSAAIPTKNYGNIGAQIVFRHMPDIQNLLATDPPVEANDFLLTVADAQQFGKVSVGAAVKTIFSTLGDKQAFAQAFDLGFKAQIWETDFAAVVQNVGPPIQYQPSSGAKDPLPLTFRLGLAKPLIVSPASTLLAGAEGMYVQNQGTQASFGVEYWHRSVLAIRVGYRLSDSQDLNGGFSVGAAFRNTIGKLEYEIGYAWRPSPISATFIASSHIFGLLFWY